MKPEELRMRRFKQLMYRINKKYLDTGQFPYLSKDHEKNEQILKNYETLQKNRD